MQHLQTHAHFRPYICPMCDAGFTSSSALEAHSRLHRQDQTRDQRETPPSGGGYRENQRPETRDQSGYRENPPNREAPRNNNLR